VSGLPAIWPHSIEAALALQKDLSARVVRKSAPKAVETIAGVDTAYAGCVARAAAVVVCYPALEVVAEAVAEKEVFFPYIPGLLAFREGPAVMDCLDRLGVRPDATIFDAHGVAHPRRLGLASHIGILIDAATIGCAKTCLVGNYREPGIQRGSYSLLREGDEVIGAALRTRTRVAPVFVSVGHRMNLEDSVRHVLEGCRGYRLPEVLRRAHQLAAFPR
jgi:deoxyribonuclease V